MDYEFEELVSELRKKAAENPKRVTKEFKKFMNQLNHTNFNPFSFEKLVLEIDPSIFLSGVAIIMIALLAFKCTEPVGFLGGIAFFLAGYYIGCFEKGMGLFFLFSHGITGLCLMEGLLLAPLFENPAFQDGSNPFYFYAAIVILLFAIATMLVFVHNLSKEARKVKFLKLVPLVLYGIGFYITAFAQYLVLGI